MRDTHAPFGTPGTFEVTFVQFLPPSFVTCRLPSSAPAYNRPARFGDSANETIAGHDWTPSSFEMRISLPFTPIVTMSSRLAPVVRSGLIAVHVRPRSAERKTFCAG